METSPALPHQPLLGPPGVTALLRLRREPSLDMTYDETDGPRDIASCVWDVDVAPAAAPRQPSPRHSQHASLSAGAQRLRSAARRQTADPPTAARQPRQATSGRGQHRRPLVGATNTDDDSTFEI